MKKDQRLRFILPIEVESNTHTNETMFDVKNVESNIGGVDLDLGWETHSPTCSNSYKQFGL